MELGRQPLVYCRYRAGRTNTQERMPIRTEDALLGLREVGVHALQWHRETVSVQSLLAR
jgi:hypothetical protein